MTTVMTFLRLRNGRKNDLKKSYRNYFYKYKTFFFYQIANLFLLNVVGVEALVSCGMMECLLKVINWIGNSQEHITVSMSKDGLYDKYLDLIGLKIFLPSVKI